MAVQFTKLATNFFTTDTFVNIRFRYKLRNKHLDWDRDTRLAVRHFSSLRE